MGRKGGSPNTNWSSAMPWVLLNLKKNEFVSGISKELRRDLDLTDPENKKLLARTSSPSASAWRGRSSTACSAWC